MDRERKKQIKREADKQTEGEKDMKSVRQGGKER